MGFADAILAEIKTPGTTQGDIAQSYAIGIRMVGADQIDWKAINAAIVERWSVSGLRSVKRRAWKLVQG